MSLGCATAQPAWVREATVGIVDPELAALVEADWIARLSEDPVQATELGVRDFDDRLADRSPEGLARTRARWRRERDALSRLLSRLAEPSDRVSAELLLGALEADIASEVCAFEEWSVSSMQNPVSEWNYLAELHAVKTPDDGERLLSRYRRIPGLIDAELAALSRGLAAGRVANAESVRRVASMLRSQLAQPRAEWPLLAPARAERPGWPAESLSRFRAELERIVDAEIAPAMGRYLALLEGPIAAKARSSEASGLGALPEGAACYRARILRHTGLPLDPAATHALGLEEIARLDREIAALGAKALGAKDLADTLARLRGDPDLYFASAEQIEAKAKEALARAEAAVPRAFGLRPKTPCVVARIPDYEAPYSTIAYYRQPIPDGSKPGQYFVNVFEPRTRPRFEAEVLAFHESVPGHHLQIAIAQERSELPSFRKHLDSTAFVEGWALYTERLADELGLYGGDLDRLGMLSFDAWRASRLVVDTGIHALGWSREQAIAFMRAHTALAENNIANEVDRYIVWPGQALAYKTGQRELLRLRAEAEAELGAAFTLPAFHDVVLGQGPVTLPVLARAVEGWIERATGPRDRTAPSPPAR